MARRKRTDDEPSSTLRILEPWEKTFRDYIGRRPIISEADFGPRERMVIEDVAEFVATRDLAPFLRFTRPETPDLAYHIDGSRLIITDAGSGERLGGIFYGTTYICPEFRGRGLGAEMVMVHEDRDRLRDAYIAAHPEKAREANWAFGWLLSPGYFSEGGFKTRLEVHRRLVERALQNGQAVPAEVLADYDHDEEGRLVRTTPWGIEEQEAWAGRIRPRTPDPEPSLAEEASILAEDDSPSP